MNRRGFAVIAAVSLAAVPIVVSTQQTTAVPRIGVLWPVSDDAELEAFRQGLRKLGYVERQNIIIEYRFAQGKNNLLPDLAAELVRLDVDVILTYGVTATRVVSQATTTIPIVSGSMSDPVAAGLVKSLGRPEGNLTGVTSRSPGLSAKRLELIKEAVPGLARVAVLSTPSPTAQLALRETEMAGKSMGLAIQVEQVQGPNDFEVAFSAMVREGAGALIVLPDTVFIQHFKRLVELAAKQRIPATYWAKEPVEAGGLMSYGANFQDQFRIAAGYIDKILKGAKPADLPIEGPTAFELVINLRTARALGLTIPQSLLMRANEIVQ